MLAVLYMFFVLSSSEFVDHFHQDKTVRRTKQSAGQNSPQYAFTDAEYHVQGTFHPLACATTLSPTSRGW